MSRSKRIAEQLGVSHGAAVHHLRKNLLFKYVCLAGQQYCYKCGAEIESPSEFSIEHKEPWEGRDVELFWSLDNIAFSHVQCNRPHKVGHRTVNTVNGQKRCRVCKEFKDLDAFYKSSNGVDGKQSHCKECHKLWRTRGSQELID